MLVKKLAHIFDGFASPDKALERGVKARDLERVRNAFTRGASPDALNLVKYSGQMATGVSSGKCLEPVILSAVKKSSLEVVEEILKHAPDLGRRIWCEQGGFKGFIPNGVLEKVAQHAHHQVTLNGAAGFDPEAEKKLAAVVQYALTARWPFKAADQGDKIAQCAMGSIYIGRQCAREDLVQAYKWYSLAGDAQVHLEFLSKKMTPDEVRQAKYLAASWRPAPASSAPPQKVP